MINKHIQPSILFVHGACHLPDMHYRELLHSLQANGFDVFAPRLPTSFQGKMNYVGLVNDAEFIRAQAEQLLDQGRYLLIICHSYGGMVITSGLNSQLSVRARCQASKPGGILHLMYLCAFLPRLGQSLVDLISKHESLLNLNVDEDGYGEVTNAIESFYNDIDLLRATCLKASLVKHPIKASTDPALDTSWLHFPITYVFCTLDNCIPINCQYEMVNQLISTGKKDISIISLESGHSPFLSRTTQTVDLIQKAWLTSVKNAQL